MIKNKLDSSNRIQVQVRIRQVSNWNGSRRIGSASPDSSTGVCLSVPHTTQNSIHPNHSNHPNSICIKDPSNRRVEKDFNYDYVFSPSESQQEVYDAGVRSLIDRCLEGYNGCIFAYGQSGSGKTHTIQGSANVKNMADKDRGIMIRAAEHISKHIHAQSGKWIHSKEGHGEKVKIEYSVKASYLEIYNENLKDLLCDEGAQAELRIRMDPDSVSGKELHVQGLTERHVVEFTDYMKIIQIGAKHRTVAETNINDVSSRSHAVLTLTIEQLQRKENDGTFGPRKRSKIHFIDLAGSERADVSGAAGIRLKEGGHINMSLLSLGNVISALSSSKSNLSNVYVPYRYEYNL